MDTDQPSQPHGSPHMHVPCGQQVDAVLPKPRIRETDYFTKRDWAVATRAERSKARRKAGPGYDLLNRQPSA